MADNVIRLPRPRTARPASENLGLFVRVGRNDHRELAHVLASGEASIFGFVVDAQNAIRHRDLIADANRRNLDVILDPKTQPMALPGGHTKSLADLPWGSERPHTFDEFDGPEGRARVKSIVAYAVAHDFTEILGPTHLIAGPNDPWLRRDIQSMKWLAEAARELKPSLGLIYSLSIPLGVLRRPAERQAIIHALADAPMEGIWLKIENFGDGASGEKTAAFIEGVRDFHQLGVPVVADHAGGLPAMAALAFGAVGGVAHGVTLNQSFSAARWRRPPVEDTPETGDEDESEGKKKGGPTSRVYLSSLDMFMKPADAAAFLAASPRISGRHSCKDTKCCPAGQKDMLKRMVRHAIYQRAREIDWLSKTPQGVRAARYVDERVRKVSDDVAAAAALPGLSEKIQKPLAKKQAVMSRFRQVMGHLVTETRSASVAITPQRRSAR